MKNLINEMMFGKSSMAGGLTALAVVMMIGLGCFCNKDKFDFGNLNTNSSPSNTSSTPTTTKATPSPEATVAYKKADASKSQVPSEDEMQDIVRKTLLDFNAALQKEDFTDFHSTVSKAWQKQTTPGEMKDKFQSFIDGQADISAIDTMKAEFTSPAEITRSTGVKTLETKGKYDTAPIDTTFELKYIAEGKEWKLASLQVITGIKRQ